MHQCIVRMGAAARREHGRDLRVHLEADVLVYRVLWTLSAASGQPPEAVEPAPGVLSCRRLRDGGSRGPDGTRVSSPRTTPIELRIPPGL